MAPTQAKERGVKEAESTSDYAKPQHLECHRPVQISSCWQTIEAENKVLSHWLRILNRLNIMVSAGARHVPKNCLIGGRHANDQDKKG